MAPVLPQQQLALPQQQPALPQQQLALPHQQQLAIPQQLLQQQLALNMSPGRRLRSLLVGHNTPLVQRK
jgi:hypothetical protein